MTMRWSEARALFELLGELRDLGDEPARWRAHLGESLRRLVGARVAVSFEGRLAPRLFSGEVTGLSHVGWESERERDIFCVLTDDPTEAAMEARGQRSYTLPRQALLHDDEWYRSSFACELSRQAGLDQFVVSHQLLPERRLFSTIVVYRSAGERALSKTELTLLDRLHRELVRLWRAPDPRLDLPRRLRQTLSELLRGRSEKEIAGALELSPHTVHQYVTMLYRRFDVRSRAELQAQVMRRVRRPLLAAELSD
jgi:DNA-binding CsgD family transcriptional regulator